MRKLITHDAFMAFRVIKEVGVEEKLIALANNIRGSKEKKTQEEIGLEFIMGILAGAGTEKAEKAVYACLAGPLEIPEDDLRNMDLMAFLEKVKEFIAFIGIEEWRDFFRSLGKILGK